MKVAFIIARGDTSFISAHFRASEFYSRSPDAPAQHEFPAELVDAAELLRTHFNCPWRITSTVRTPTQERRICIANNLPLGLATTSQHVLKKAFDSQPASTPARNAEIMAELATDFESQGEIFQALRKIGVMGFGLYDTFIHLDTRTGPCKHKDAFGRFAAWDERHVPAKKNQLGFRFGIRPATLRRARRCCPTRSQL